MQFNVITNPKTGRKLSIYSSKGKKVLYKYIRQFAGSQNILLPTLAIGETGKTVLANYINYLKYLIGGAPKKDDKEDYSIELATILASQFHENWCYARNYKPKKKNATLKDGSKDEEWIDAHKGKTSLDIANTKFEDLPLGWKHENFEEAKVVVNLVLNAAGKDIKLDANFIEEASTVVHNEWRKRTTSAKGGDLDVLYKDLSEEEKEKNRSQIKQGIKLYEIQ